MEEKKCKSLTSKGNECQASAIYRGYCYQHGLKNPDPEKENCSICCEPFKDSEISLSCGHWIHKNCVKKSTEALQDIREDTGHPSLKEHVCPLCKKPLTEMRKPRFIKKEKHFTIEDLIKSPFLPLTCLLEKEILRKNI